jgi:hypothetical protein
MLTERLLPPSEWNRLAGTLLDPAWRTFSQSDKVIVVEDGGQIVACSALMQVYHLEGTWIHPAYRQRVSVGRRLVLAMRQLFKALHVGEVLMHATNDANARMCRKLGQAMPLPGEHFAVIVEEDGRPIVWKEVA